MTITEEYKDLHCCVCNETHKAKYVGGAPESSNAPALCLDCAIQIARDQIAIVSGSEDIAEGFVQTARIHYGMDHNPLAKLIMTMLGLIAETRTH